MVIRMENIAEARKTGKEEGGITRRMNSTVPARTIRKKTRAFGAK